MTRWLLLLALPALLAAGSAASARTPMMEPTRSYYGPVRACHPLFALDVRAGEAYLDSGGEHILRFGDHYLSAGRRWFLADPIYRDIVRPLGTIELPGVGTLERIALSSRNAPGATIVYLYDTRDGGPFPRMEIRSDAFDGSARDVALLGRIMFGEAGRAMCASVPEELRARPEREDADAFWVRPDRPAGPLTLCWAGLAYDVRAGESAIRFWHPEWQLFGAASGATRVTISGSFASLRDPAGRIFSGSLAASPAFEVRAAGQAPALPPAMRSGEGSVPVFARLLRRLHLPHPDLQPVGGVAFAFSGPATPADIAAFIARLRPRTAGDTCFEEGGR